MDTEYYRNKYTWKNVVTLLSFLVSFASFAFEVYSIGLLFLVVFFVMALMGYVRPTKMDDGYKKNIKQMYKFFFFFTIIFLPIIIYLLNSLDILWQSNGFVILVIYLGLITYFYYEYQQN